MHIYKSLFLWKVNIHTSYSLSSNLGRIPRGSASADLKPKKSFIRFFRPRKTSESFSWRQKLPVAKRKNSQILQPLGLLGLRIFR